MKFTASTIIVAALGAFFAPGVAADPHYECSCSTWNGRGWTYDWQLTFNACKNNYEGEANYNHGQGRCKWFSHKRVDGDDWNHVCEAQARDGYYPVANDVIDSTQTKITGKSGHGFCKR
ncbi:hypothetical protein BDP55DRAFT_739151 [Colletotrichum godetiae]|uniref:Uncharacterized protein n=1 Tax=Colletotrichum godetiae TaxID=1209918 RepID=A0AAJ0A5E2_9PEZI|nr:uncharacterized protein BDP55DRAFT_739151 [Colletotrichum godetiae]KAK1656780.1 hypothetical protein BDP55DRAFT_739151 [Colletotrichum godetiae]